MNAGAYGSARASTSGKTERVSEQQIRFEIEFATSQQDGDAVIADGAGEQDFVACDSTPRAKCSGPESAGRCRKL